MKSIFTILLLVLAGQSIAQISSAEYFIDTDPGVENGVSIPVSSDFMIAENINISTDGLEAGFHTVYVRVKDTEEAWSLYDKQAFHVTYPVNSTGITEAEYFLDIDPGLGNGNQISITEAYTLEESFQLDTEGLSDGFHTLFVRVKDSNEGWGLYDKQSFYVAATVNSIAIIDAEYFIDIDPGLGNGTEISVTEGFTLEEDFLVNTEGLELGFHTLYVRVKDGNEGWTLYDKQNFRIQDSGPIIAAEYFIDSDPGLGNAEEISIQSGHNIYEEPQLATLGLDPGLHILYVRVMDSDNVWSPADTAEFTIVLVDGLSEMTTSTFVIYPNPTSERINLNTDEPIQRLSVYDDQGRIVKSQSDNRYQINVNDLAPGSYLLEVLSSDVRHQFRFIKE
jgi:hypothetical protein